MEERGEHLDAPLLLAQGGPARLQVGQGGEAGVLVELPLLGGEGHGHAHVRAGGELGLHLRLGAPQEEGLEHPGQRGRRRRVDALLNRRGEALPEGLPAPEQLGEDDGEDTP